MWAGWCLGSCLPGLGPPASDPWSDVALTWARVPGARLGDDRGEARGAGCCSRGSAWASPLAPGDVLLLERLQSCVPAGIRRPPGASGSWSCPESRRLWQVRTESQSHRFHHQGQEFLRCTRKLPAPRPHLHLHGMKCATSAHTSQKCNLDFPRKRLPRNTHPCGPQWECPRLSESRVLSSSRAIPGYDPSGASFRKKQRVRTLGSALVPTTDLLNPVGLFIWPFFVSAFPRLFFLLTL